MKKYLIVVIALIFAACTNITETENKTEEKTVSVNKEKTTEIKEQKQSKNLPPKPENYSWYFEMCTYTGTFDANKFTKKELDNTLKFLINSEGVSKPFSIFKPEDLKRIDKNEIEAKLNATLDNYKNLNFVNTPYFDNIKTKQIAALDRIKLLSLMEIKSFDTPKVLQNDAYSKNQCSEYTQALVSGGEELFAIRKQMAEKSRDAGNNSAWEQYTKEINSDNKLELAQVHVTVFGWWNCINKSIERVDPYTTHKEFEKLFSDVSKVCETP